jgi:radical SAM superfamily enzyme with C-terminal helix-hairpin-helix motif
MIEVIGLFGYIGIFWLTWKGLDWVYHRIRGDKAVHCSFCQARERTVEGYRKRVRELEAQVEGLRERLTQASQYEHHVGDYRLIQQLNIATQGALESVHGIGPKRARQIVENRPFYTMQEVRAILPEWLIQQARKRLSWRGTVA